MKPFALVLSLTFSGSVMPVAAETPNKLPLTGQIELIRSGLMTRPNKIHVDLKTQRLTLDDDRGSTTIELTSSAAYNIQQAGIDLIDSPRTKKTCPPTADSGGQMTVQVGAQKYSSIIFRGCQTPAEEHLENLLSCAAYPVASPVCDGR